jgi:hypothetical protein
MLMHRVTSGVGAKLNSVRKPNQFSGRHPVGNGRRMAAGTAVKRN